MRNKRLKISAAIMLGLGLTGLQAQTMYVKQSTGTQTAYALSNIQKMIFSGGNVVVNKTDNSSEVYALIGLRYLKFTDLTSSIEGTVSVESQMLNVYPNPVSNKLHIELSGTVQGGGMLSILNFEGKTVLSQQISHAGLHTLDISYMPKGIYLCRYSNATDLKTVKIIKQ